MRYNYEELEQKALAPAATQEDINALGEWFSLYGSTFWNGECYTIDADHALWPVYEEHFDENGEFDYADIIGYEIHLS